MEEPSTNYDLTFRSFSQKIEDMRMGRIKNAATESLPQPPCRVHRGGESQDRHSTKPQHPENAAQLACGCIKE